ncbi:MAG: hypothetical protein HQK76_10560 [Desulfobacterales bacterium]|nr:hypothetical protein [Desulfobacterales bacterium]
MLRQEDLLENLRDIFKKLDVKVNEQNFRNVGIKVQSGLCKVKGDSIFILDKHKSIREKNEILAVHLSKVDLSEFYILPAVRDYIERYR